MSDSASFRAIIYGRVQGVFFRAFVNRCAKELGLAGYVCNLPDGTVEVRVEGEKQQLEELVGYLKKGPPGARVDKVITNWTKYTGQHHGFIVR